MVFTICREPRIRSDQVVTQPRLEENLMHEPMRTSSNLSRNKQTVLRYLDGYRGPDHEQILSTLTDDIRWTIFGAARLHGKAEYDANIEGPEFVGAPEIRIVRLIEENDVVMGELTVEVRRITGESMRAAMGEVFVMRDGLIAERRAYVIELTENDYK